MACDNERERISSEHTTLLQTLEVILRVTTRLFDKAHHTLLPVVVYYYRIMPFGIAILYTSLSYLSLVDMNGVISDERDTFGRPVITQMSQTIVEDAASLKELDESSFGDIKSGEPPLLFREE